MAEEKPKAPAGADIMAAIESHRAESRANDAAILKALESIMAKQAEQDAKLDALRVSNTGTTARTGASAPGAGTGSGERVKFGRDKGKRLDEVGDLDWYRNAIAESVDNPEKAKWRDQNVMHLEAIDAEIARRNGGGNSAQAAFETQRTGGGEPPPYFDERPPPDDDVPF